MRPKCQVNSASVAKRMVQGLKKRRPRDLDGQFANAHEAVFGYMDCLACANCCKTISPMFFQSDIEQLAEALRVKPRQFIDRYLRLDTDGIYALQSIPCPFLGADNRCSVYEYRPKACREYPHTDHRKMHNKLDLAFNNLPICPAVSVILERIARHYQIIT